jgi:transcriptional regulator of acetoin/glycerol metabolism/DNA-binding CsgD family transcriptional regulator
MVRDRSNASQCGGDFREEVAGLRLEIAESWRRSARWGVRRDRLELTCDREIEPGLVGRFGTIVLRRLADDLDGAQVSVVLADDQARVVDWCVGTKGLAGILDGFGLSYGSCWSEQQVGTNGIGTAIVAERPVWIRGREHYAEPLTTFASAAAPIEHPWTGQLVGVVAVSCTADQSNALMPPLARHAARDVEERLGGDSSTTTPSPVDPACTCRNAGAAGRRQATGPRFGWQSLTTTERRVAAAVAAGLTNAEVARQLFVSPYTVDFHLRQIFRKLGIHSRVQLAALLARP